MQYMVETKNLRKVYRTGDEKVVALDNIDLTIEQGQVCCILGTSGSGKSTLLNQLAGLEKPTRGTVKIKGELISKMSEKQLAVFRQKHIGFVFQSYNLIQGMTAVENVAMPLMFRRVSRKKREEAAREMLKQVGLGERMDHRPNEMSGGQQQRVGIARAFVTNPEVVFADEPTGNLDTKTTKEVMEMFLRFAREKGTTIILVTHDRSLAEYCDRIVTISDGRIISNEDHRHAKAIQDPPAAPAEELPETLQFTDNTLAAYHRCCRRFQHWFLTLLFFRNCLFIIHIWLRYLQMQHWEYHFVY